MLDIVVLLLLTRKLRAPWREVARGAWAAMLVALGFGALFISKRLALRPNINPFLPGVWKLSGILMFAESFVVVMLILLPFFFDGLERLGASWLIAVRQLRARKSGFLTAISFLAFCGVGISSFGLCFTVSIMGGFGNDLKKKILGNNAHVVIDRDRKGITDWESLVADVRAVPGVKSATPLVQGEVMVVSVANLSGAIFRGIDPAGDGPTANLSKQLIRGKLRYLTEPERLLTLTAEERAPISAKESDGRDPMGGIGGPAPLPRDPTPVPRSGVIAGDVLPGIIIGRELATNLRLSAGDEVRVVSPFGGPLTPAGPLPKTQWYRVAGIFYTGMYEYDMKYVYVTIPVAQNFLMMQPNEISSIEVRVNDEDHADRIAEQLRPRFESRELRVRDWKQLNKNLFRALKLEKLIMFVMLGVAIVVASFAIVATLLLLVTEKGREIAVLKAMGASDGMIARVFVLVGLLIGIVGSTIGVGGAFLVCGLIQKLGIPLDPEVYYINKLPVFISFSDYGLVMLIAVGFCMVATFYPAAAAARLKPVEGMRFG